MLVQTYRGDYNYRLFLCSANKSILCELDYKNVNYKPFFNNYNELQFEIDYYDNGSVWSKDARYDLLKGLYHVLLNIVEGDTIVASEYFVITEPEDSFDGGKVSKNINCIASHYMTFNTKRLRGYDSTVVNEGVATYLYDNVSDKGILNYILEELLLNTWSISYINSDFLTEVRLFKFDNNTLTDVFKQLEHDYNAVFVFDNVNNTISVYKKSEFVDNSGLVLSANNFLDKLSYKPKYDQMITRLYVYGKTDGGVKTNISRYNITGQLYVDKFDWFIDNGYFSADLISAWNTYEAKITSNQSAFDGYIDNWITYNSDLLTLQGQLSALETQKQQIETAMDAIKRSNYKNNASYSSSYSDLQSKEGEITSKEGEITAKEGQITSVENSMALISADLSYATNFTSTQLEELINFIYEDTLTINTVDDGELLYQYALQYIDEKSNPIYDISIDIVDIFSAYEASVVRDKLVLGNYAYIDCPEIGFTNLPLQLVSYSHNKTNNQLTLQFSNTTKLESDLYYLNDIFRKANQASDDVGLNKDNWGEYSNDKANIIYLGEEIDAEDNVIVAGNHYINQRGFIGTNDLQGYGEIQVLADRIIFSKDAWQTFYTMLSANGLYLESANAYGATPTSTDPISRIVITPEYGFQIDQWNPALNSGDGDWGNVVYIGTDGQFHIDNGYIELTRITGATPTTTNRILIDPSEGIKISKNTTQESATPTWFDVFYLNTDGDIQLADENGNGIILDQFGMDTKFIKWFKNMCWNSSFEAYDLNTDIPYYWSGGISSADSSWFGTRSMRLNAGVSSEQAAYGGLTPTINPEWYSTLQLGATPVTMTKTRVSFHKKKGKCRISVLDVSDGNSPFTLTVSDQSLVNGATGTSIEYPHNDNWEAPSYSVVFEHGSSTSIKVKFENTDATNECYIDSVIVEPDFTGRRPSFYTDGPNSISANQVVGLYNYDTEIFVQADEPATAKEEDIWIDTDDYSRYDMMTISADTTLLLSDEEFIVVDTADVTVTLADPTQSGVVCMIKNISSGMVTLSGSVDNVLSMVLFPLEAVNIISDGAKWRIV